MWLEVKATVTIIGCFIITIIIALSGNLIFALLCSMAIATFIFGDLLFGWKVVSTDAVHLIDPTGAGEKIIDLHLIGGGRRFIKATKSALGKWEFVYHKRKCSIIDDGKYPTRLSNGNPCVVAHESRDRALNYKHAKLLEKLFEKHNVTNIKDLYLVLINLENEQIKKQVKA